jgi:thiamine pyrophosphokinase
MRAIIFANGIIDPEQQPNLDFVPGDVVIAADGGVRNSFLFGVRPDIVIGDLDSITAQEIELLSVDSPRFISYPTDKDQTDLELALDYAIQIGAAEVLLFGLLGGRLDQTLANLLLLSKDAYSPLKIVLSASYDTGHLLRDQDTLTLKADIGDIISLIPLSMSVRGVTTQGLRWPLDKANLDFGSTRSISNEVIMMRVSIQIDTGKLLVIHRHDGNAN